MADDVDVICQRPLSKMTENGYKYVYKPASFVASGSKPSNISDTMVSWVSWIIRQRLLSTHLK